MTSPDNQRNLVFPDLKSHCTFPLSINPHSDTCSINTDAWIESTGVLPEKRGAAQAGLKCGLVAAMCYPYADLPELQVSCDFLNYLFHVDDLMDDMGTKDARVAGDVVLDVLHAPERWKGRVAIGEGPAIARLAYDFWIRMIRTAGPGVQSRFIDTVTAYFQAVHQQTKERELGLVPTLEGYTLLRRETSGCRPCFVLIKYAAQMDLPSEVVEQPTLKSLTQGANDLVAWSNGWFSNIFSYDREQSRRDKHNLIAVFMTEKSLTLQSAVDFAGNMCRQTIDRFVNDCASLPSWDPETDSDVSGYVHALEDWIVGSLHWSFETERYVGTVGKAIKESRALTLRPVQKA